MDVQDRAARLDVLTVTTPSASVGSAPAPPPDTKTPSFAKSLHRPTRESPAEEERTSSSPSQSDSPAATPEPRAGTEHGTKSSATPSPPTVLNASETTPSDAARSPAEDSNTELIAADAEEGIDEAIQLLIAGLVTAAPAASHAPAAASPAGLPPQPPPVSLIHALQVPTEPNIASESSTELKALDPLPAIPAGLQFGLSQNIVPPQERAAASFTANEKAVTAPPPSRPEDQIRLMDSAASLAIPPRNHSRAEGSEALIAKSRPTVARLPAISVEPIAAIVSSSSATTQPDLPIRQIVGPPDVAAQSVEQIPTDSGSQTVQDTDRRTATSVKPLGTESVLAEDSTPPDGIPVFSTGLSAVAPDQSQPSAMNGIPPSKRSLASPAAAERSAGDERMLVAGLSGSIGESPTSAAGIHFVPSAAPTAATNSAVPSVVEQLQPALHLAITQDRELSMTLRPPELGAVRIEVQHQDGRLSARLYTETASAHQLLTEQLPQLREALTPMGVAADQVQVMRTESPPGSSASGSAAGSQADARHSGARQESPPQRPPEPPRIDEPEREDAQRPALRTRTSLNLRV